MLNKGVLLRLTRLRLHPRKQTRQPLVPLIALNTASEGVIAYKGGGGLDVRWVYSCVM